jgi:hypothetical protein
MAGHRTRSEFRPIANAPKCVEKSMRVPSAYATILLTPDMNVMLIATDPSRTARELSMLPWAIRSLVAARSSAA